MYGTIGLDWLALITSCHQPSLKVGSLETHGDANCAHEIRIDHLKRFFEVRGVSTLTHHPCPGCVASLFVTHSPCFKKVIIIEEGTNNILFNPVGRVH